MERPFYVSARFFPQAAKEQVGVMLRYCGSTITPDYWLGRAFVISAITFFLVSTVLFFIVENYVETVLLLLVAILLYHLATYLILYFKAESRGKAVEKVLSNLLQLIAANLNSGMTPFQAYKEASRPEFGILKLEMDRSIALSLSTMQFHDALMDMTMRVKSTMFRDVIELFIEGMKTGGPLAVLLSDIAKDIREDMDLRREIITRSKSYMLFIGFIVVFGTPLLSAVSVHFIRTIESITSEVKVEVPEIQNVGGITFGQLTLTSEFLSKMAGVNIAATALIASWLLAVISEGKDKYTVKYALFVVPLSLIVFYALDYAMGFII